MLNIICTFVLSVVKSETGSIRVWGLQRVDSLTLSSEKITPTYLY